MQFETLKCRLVPFWLIQKTKNARIVVVKKSEYDGEII